MEESAGDGAAVGGSDLSPPRSADPNAPRCLGGVWSAARPSPGRGEEKPAGEPSKRTSARKRSAASRTSKARSSPGTGTAPQKAQETPTGARRPSRSSRSRREVLATVFAVISCQTSPLGGDGWGRGRASGRRTRAWRSPQGDDEVVGGCRCRRGRRAASLADAGGETVAGRVEERPARGTVGGGEDFEGVFVAGCGTSTSKGAETPSRARRPSRSGRSRRGGGWR